MELILLTGYYHTGAPGNLRIRNVYGHIMYDI